MAKSTSEELVLITPQQTKLITETIETKLAVENVTDQVIAKYRKESMALTINGPDDKAGYEAVYEMRQKGKKTRILATKICKKGREPLQAEVALWIDKETEINAAIKEAESYLLGLEQNYEAAKQKIEDDRQKEIVERLKFRNDALTPMGVKCNGVDYYLDELNFPLSLVKNSEDSFFNDQIFHPFAKLFLAKEEIRVAKEKEIREYQEQQEKERKEREEQQRKEKEEMEKREKELKDKEAKIKAEQDKIEREKLNTLKAKIKARSEELELLGFTYSLHHEKYIFKGVLSIDPEALSLHDEDEWSKLIEETKPKVEEHLKVLRDQEEEKQRRLNQEAIEKAEHEKKEKEIAEEAKRQLSIEAGKDKVKYNETVEYLKATPVYEMRSSQYRQKMIAIRNFIDDLK